MMAVLRSISLIGRRRDDGVYLTESDGLNAASHQLDGLTKSRRHSCNRNRLAFTGRSVDLGQRLPAEPLK